MYVCTGVAGKVTVTDVVVEGCNAAPCALKKGTNATVTITFKLGKFVVYLLKHSSSQHGINCSRRRLTRCAKIWSTLK